MPTAAPRLILLAPMEGVLDHSLRDVLTLFYSNIGTIQVNVLGYHLFGGGTVDIQSIGAQEVQAIALLAFAMLFANYADAFSTPRWPYAPHSTW